MELWGITDNGLVRQQNQDAFKTVYDEDRGIAALVVCDGMGGANAGNVASSLAVTEFMHHCGKYIENAGDMDDIASVMSDSVFAANLAVYDKASHNDECAGMGTTLCAAISTKDGEVIANIGDSRVYHIKHNKISQITRDHSVVADMVKRGDITQSEARKHPSKHLITRVLGTSRDERPDLFFVYMDKGDSLLLCTDGLSNIALDGEMLFEIRRCASVRESCESLIELALSRGAPDNVTAVIYKK